MGARREADDLLAAVGRGAPKGHVAPVTEGSHDLARSLASDAELPADPGSRDLLGLAAEPEHSTVGESPIREAGGGHLLVEPALVADPRPPQGSTQGERPARRSTPVRWSVPLGRTGVAIPHGARGGRMTTMVVILRDELPGWRGRHTKAAPCPEPRGALEPASAA